jgi:2,4-dienoyl-CoA reductase-like NADH-dependent reductase (Old Yellow Enzyme family)
MCMYSSENGFLNDFHVSHYGSFALKGAGAVIVEATAVEPRGRISPGDAGLWDDDHIAPLRRVVDVIKSQGAAAGMQIAHAGRKASISPPFNGDYLISEADGGWPSDIVGASDDLPFASHYGVPHGLTKEEIKQTVKKFADAAIRADKAGLDFLEIHAAHG